ncbi:hypothetical protein Hamer_G027106 [Homarus americanus]|uniref:Uncharacterized protein n=1 Tax=Homarus americanus TaxID=6706 RepID=A0A8J5N830_HOMAM|nr:hypothetical protein Hamer_G027106 [Homarus americanus]
MCPFNPSDSLNVSWNGIEDLKYKHKIVTIQVHGPRHIEIELNSMKLAHYVWHYLHSKTGFDELESEDIEDVLASHTEELTNQELQQLTEHSPVEDDDDDNNEEESQRMLTSKRFFSTRTMLNKLPDYRAKMTPNKYQYGYLRDSPAKMDHTAGTLSLSPTKNSPTTSLLFILFQFLTLTDCDQFSTEQ